MIINKIVAITPAREKKHAKRNVRTIETIKNVETKVTILGKRYMVKTEKDDDGEKKNNQKSENIRIELKIPKTTIFGE